MAALGIACLVAFGAAAGSVDAPQLDVAESYDVSIDADSLLTLSGGEGGGRAVSSFDVYGLEVSTGGRFGGTSGVWLLGLFALWVLVMIRLMGGSTAIAVVVIVAVAIAAMLFVNVGDSRSSAATVVEYGDLGLLDAIALLLLGVVTVLSGVVLLLPDDAAGYTADLTLPVFLSAAFSGLSRRLKGLSIDRSGGRAPEPDNEVYEAWIQLDRQYGAPERTPGEVVERALASGVPEEPVRNLRRVFEEVRYGGVSPDQDHVRRAREAVSRVLDEAAPGQGVGHDQDHRSESDEDSDRDSIREQAVGSGPSTCCGSGSTEADRANDGPTDRRGDDP